MNTKLYSNALVLNISNVYVVIHFFINLWPGARSLASLPFFQFVLLLNFLATLPLSTLKNTA